MGCSWCQQDDSPTVRDQDSSYHPANNRGGEDPAGVDEGKTQDISNILLVKNNCCYIIIKAAIDWPQDRFGLIRPGPTATTECEAGAIIRMP